MSTAAAATPSAPFQPAHASWQHTSWAPAPDSTTRRNPSLTPEPPRHWQHGDSAAVPKPGRAEGGAAGVTWRDEAEVKMASDAASDAAVAAAARALAAAPASEAGAATPAPSVASRREALEAREALKAAARAQVGKAQSYLDGKAQMQWDAERLRCRTAAAVLEMGRIDNETMKMVM